MAALRSVDVLHLCNRIAPTDVTALDRMREPGTCQPQEHYLALQTSQGCLSFAHSIKMYLVLPSGLYVILCWFIPMVFKSSSWRGFSTLMAVNEAESAVWAVCGTLHLSSIDLPRADVSEHWAWLMARSYEQRLQSLTFWRSAIGHATQSDRIGV